MTTWAVVGASGFVGSAICRHLERAGHRVTPVAAPRLTAAGTDGPDALAAQALQHEVVPALAARLAGHDVVVNAAGLAEPGAAPSPRLEGANALLPAVVAVAAHGARRMVHLSSAAVQGRRVLDESHAISPFSAYSRSKARAERVLAEFELPGPRARVAPVVTLRATSVQGPGRPTTERLLSLAASRWAVVAGPGDRPTALTHVDNLAALVEFVGQHPGSPPPVVMQPWDGLRTAEALRLLGGREPRHLPEPLVRTALALGRRLTQVVGGAGAVRRLEVLTLGQQQRPGWPEHNGFSPPLPGRVWAAELGGR